MVNSDKKCQDLEELDHFKLSSLAKHVYKCCLDFFPNCVTQDDIQNMLEDKSLQDLEKIINELLGARLIDAFVQGNQLIYRAVQKDEAKKISLMDGDEAMVFNYIKDASNEGIWSRTIKMKTNLHTTVLNRALKSLESKQLIKAVKSVKNPTRKIFMVYDLVPSIELTGGPWFTDQEMDLEFIERLQGALYKYILFHSYPKSKDTLFPPSYSGYLTAQQIYSWLKNSGITEVDLELPDVISLLDVLVYDRKIEYCQNGTAFRALRKANYENIYDFTEAACESCSINNIVSSEKNMVNDFCIYFRSWLDNNKHADILVDKEDHDTEHLGREGTNIILGIISQLKPGMDLSRITLPTFVLEPKSMLERITNFMCHPELLLNVPLIDDPIERFIGICRFYLSGWHIRPRSVKKPLNPILGEHFTCKWEFPDKSEALYIAEQVSHHPPISAYFYMSPENNVRIDGVLKPKSKFLGNSAGTIMEGKAILTFINRDEEYTLTQPNMYARGILFGRLRFELGDHSYIKCQKNDLIADIEFKTKGFISGTYNVIVGKIKRESSGEVLYEVSGKWDEEMIIKNIKKTGESSILFDATDSTYTQPIVRPEYEQEDRESRKLWSKVIDAIIKNDQDTATEAKSAIEDLQREEQKTRDANGKKWVPRFFERTETDDYILKTKINWTTPDDIKRQIESIVRISEKGKSVFDHNKSFDSNRIFYNSHVKIPSSSSFFTQKMSDEDDFYDAVDSFSIDVNS
ncbi:hypothetical protein PORY_001410 [Pneumocystis oryctolagi]|uniref:Uncharacterized protein n=1 Tax=Pneumocystis oryctolagi TaxID=42067 RepID=A0ACB7CCM0_9ASCO|nr:hypothetical protein PORY_001410 [Pneumocystis oryctolagi]